jgi:hypothetical protein
MQEAEWRTYSIYLCICVHGSFTLYVLARPNPAGKHDTTTNSVFTNNKGHQHLKNESEMKIIVEKRRRRKKERKKERKKTGARGMKKPENGNENGES